MVEQNNIPLYKRIIFIGYMGAGKTTLGKALSNEIKLPFYDLDFYIENRRHKSIDNLFKEFGETGFRKIEHFMLHEVAEFENIILSSGGGTPCFFDNIDYMNKQGITIFLKATPEVLFTHIKMSKKIRPLLLNKTEEDIKDFIKSELKKREQFYQKAKYTVNIETLDNKQKIQDTVRQLKNIIYNKIEENK